MTKKTGGSGFSCSGSSCINCIKILFLLIVVLLFLQQAQCVCSAYAEQCRKTLYYGYCGRIGRYFGKACPALCHCYACRRYCHYGYHHQFFLSSERGRFPLPFHAFYFTIFTTSSPTFTINTPCAGTDISFSPSTATALLTNTPFTV